MTDNKYNEIIERLREAKVDLGDAVLTIMERMRKRNWKRTWRISMKKRSRNSIGTLFY